MNKLVKKSMAGLLAGVMAITSLAVGSISAMAKEVPATSTAIALNQTVSFTRDVTDLDGSKVPVYSFKPATTGYYAISFSSDAVVLAANKATNTRSDSAKLTVYSNDGKSYDLAEETTISSWSSYTATNKVNYVAATDTTTPIETVNGYVNGYSVMTLYSQETYYFYASLTQYTDDASVKQYSKANLTISAADYIVNRYTRIDETRTNTSTGYDKVVTRTPYYDVNYCGAAKDIVVPDQINGVNVEGVYAPDDTYHNQKNITSLTLGKNVKEVGGFSSKSQLATVVLNEGLETIGKSAFAYDTALAGRLVIPSTVKYVGTKAFYSTNYNSAQVLNATAEIGTFAFGFKEAHDDTRVSPTAVTEVAVPGFFMMGATGSTAAAYAADNGIAFYDPANCSHAWAVTATKAATYFAKGSTTYTCGVCGATKTEAIAKKKIAIKSVKSAKKGQITVKTDALESKVTGYQIQYSTSKKFTKKTTKTVTVKTNSKKALSKTIKGLKAGKKYYVRIRVYSGKNNSAYSATKTVKVKK